MVRSLAILSIALAGIIHLAITPSHYSHAPAHGIFFATSGIAELIWAFAFWQKFDKMRYYAGLALSGGLIILWLLTQIFGAPFGDGAEPLDAGAISSKLAELIGFIALIWLGIEQKRETLSLSKMPRLGIEALILAVVFGLASFSVGFALEPAMPSLQHATDDHHADDDGQSEDDHHDEADMHAEDADDHHDGESTEADHHDDDDNKNSEDDHHAEDSQDETDMHAEDADDHHDDTSATDSEKVDDHHDSEATDADQHDDDDGHHDDDNKSSH